MQTSIGFSLPKSFVAEIDKIAHSIGLNRSELCLQVMRRRLMFNSDAPLSIEPSRSTYRTGHRRVVGFRCSDAFRKDIIDAADLFDMDYSLFIFYCLRAYVLEGTKRKSKPGKRK